MAVDLVLASSTLIEERQLEQSPNIGSLTGKGYENGNIGGMILGVLAIGVEVDRPLVAADGEIVAGDVFADADALGQGITLDHEVVGAIDGVSYRPRARR